MLPVIDITVTKGSLLGYVLKFFGILGGGGSVVVTERD